MKSKFFPKIQIPPKSCHPSQCLWCRVLEISSPSSDVKQTLSSASVWNHVGRGSAANTDEYLLDRGAVWGKFSIFKEETVLLWLFSKPGVLMRDRWARSRVLLGFWTCLNMKELSNMLLNITFSSVNICWGHKKRGIHSRKGDFPLFKTSYYLKCLCVLS